MKLTSSSNTYENTDSIDLLNFYETNAMKNTISLMLIESAKDDPTALTSLLNDVLFETSIPYERLKKIAYAHFGIPGNVFENTVLKLCFTNPYLHKETNVYDIN